MSEPLMSAFRMGRLLARWRFYAMQRLFGCVEVEQVLSEVSTSLETAARGLVSATRRSDIQCAVAEWQQGWNLTLASEWLMEEQTFTVRELSNHEEQSDFTAERRQRLTTLVGVVDDSVNALRQKIHGYLDESGIGVMNLGEQVEMAVCSPDVADMLPGRLSPPPPNPDGNEGDTDTAWTRPPRPEPPFALAHRRFAPGDLPPPSNWAETVQRIWQELTLLTAKTELPSVVQSETALIHDRIEPIESALSQAIQRLSRDDVTGGQPRVHYLGLTYDEDRRTVGRSGLNESVDFSSSLLYWELFHKLLKSQRVYLNREELSDVWSEVLERDDPAGPTINNALSHLRRMLRPLNIDVHPQRNLGWRLDELSNDVLG